MRERLIERLSWDEVAADLAANRLVIVPIGAFAKEHGRHLPMNTDALTAQALALAAAEPLDALVAPVVGFGHYPAFVRYAGSQSLSPETFGALLRELLQGLVEQGARRLLLLNTGVSTERTVDQVALSLTAEPVVRPLVAHLRHLGNDADIDWRQKGGGHADARETSLLLAIAPETVRTARAEPAESTAAEARKFPLSPYPDPDAHFSPSGATGDPTMADAEKGRRLLDAIVDEIVALGRTA